MTNQIQRTQQPKLTDQVLARVNEIQKQQGLALPAQYNASNALNAAYLALQKVKTKNGQNALQTCDRNSVSKALLDMVLQGLSPAKEQCYFIAYGNQLQMQRSYFGAVAAVKRISGVKKVIAEVVHQDDVFELGSDEDMELIVKKFVPNFANQDKPIIGAFALIKTDEGNRYTVMTIKEIKQSWSQTRQKNNRVQQNFGQEMAKRTVLNRAAKMFINTTDDSDLLTAAINDTTKNEYDDNPKDITTEAQQEDDKAKAENLMKQALGGDDDANSNGQEGPEPEDEYEAVDQQLQTADEG